MKHDTHVMRRRCALTLASYFLEDPRRVCGQEVSLPNANGWSQAQARLDRNAIQYLSFFTQKNNRGLYSFLTVVFRFPFFQKKKMFFYFFNILTVVFQFTFFSKFCCFFLSFFLYILFFHQVSPFLSFFFPKSLIFL